MLKKEAHMKQTCVAIYQSVRCHNAEIHDVEYHIHFKYIRT
jgi:hypothetical protein